MIPDRIEREVVLRHPVERVWDALTTAEGLAGWFGSHAEIDLQPGGRALFRWEEWNEQGEATVTVVEPPRRFGFRWGIEGLPPHDPRRTEVIFMLSAVGESTRLRVVETGFAQVAEDVARAAYKANSDGWDSELADLVAYLDGRVA
jgi:uncharacterized protein YndB with AHSA1/START domain